MGGAAWNSASPKSPQSSSSSSSSSSCALFLSSADVSTAAVTVEAEGAGGEGAKGCGVGRWASVGGAGGASKSPKSLVSSLLLSGGEAAIASGVDTSRRTARDNRGKHEEERG